MDDDGPAFFVGLALGLIIAALIAVAVWKGKVPHPHPTDGCPVCDELKAAEAEIERIKKGGA